MHFGGAGDWSAYLNHPWHADSEGDKAKMSWLAKILDLIRDGKHPSLWTDISYTLFPDDEYVYLLRVLLSDERVRSRVLFGSDFLRCGERGARGETPSGSGAVLGEDVFRTIAEVNPTKYLGEA